MKKIIAIAAVIVLLLPLLSLTAFAAVDNDATGWDVLDGIGNFFRDLRAQIKSSLSTIGDFFGNLITAISNAVESLLNGIVRLFVPHKNYFSSVNASLRSALAIKFGGFNYLTNYLGNGFSKLSAKHDIDKLLTVTFPRGHILNGMSFNLLSYIPYFATVARPALSGFVMLITVLFCYSRIKEMINT